MSARMSANTKTGPLTQCTLLASGVLLLFELVGVDGPS